MVKPQFGEIHTQNQPNEPRIEIPFDFEISQPCLVRNTDWKQTVATVAIIVQEIRSSIYLNDRDLGMSHVSSMAKCV